MESSIKAIRRESVGTSSAKKVRNSGLVPAVVYGANFNNAHIAIDEREITKVVRKHGSGTKVKLNIDGKEEMAIIKNLQLDVMKGNIIHIEFQHLSAGQAVETALPINFEGEDNFPKNTVLQKVVHELNIEALPKDLIDNITINVGDMKAGDVLTLSDLDKEQFTGISFLDDPDTAIATLMESKMEVEESVEETEEGEESVEETEEAAEESAE